MVLLKMTFSANRRSGMMSELLLQQRGGRPRTGDTFLQRPATSSFPHAHDLEGLEAQPPPAPPPLRPGVTGAANWG